MFSHLVKSVLLVALPVPFSLFCAISLFGNINFALLVFSYSFLALIIPLLLIGMPLAFLGLKTNRLSYKPFLIAGMVLPCGFVFYDQLHGLDSSEIWQIQYLVACGFGAILSMVFWSAVKDYETI